MSPGDTPFTRAWRCPEHSSQHFRLDRDGMFNAGGERCPSPVKNRSPLGCEDMAMLGLVSSSLRIFYFRESESKRGVQ